ncbi:MULTISPECIES: zinc metalloprotease HtpX [Anaeromyxobacter]|uniref:zinc metalloprotease HtpX n=1 Tax=Anaeromyxobacter TaxID=161492 RepID=UPI001F5A3BFC|nr:MULTISPECIES: zinc metalloprotease HtpX [unclassified Anaeromyxobacter]
MMNQFKTVLLLGALSAILVGVGASLGPNAFWLFTALAVAMNLVSYFFSDRIVLRMHRARELPEAEAPRLHGIVAELAGRAGIPKPRVFFMDDPHANAFATGRDPKHAVVAVTRGIVEILDERELRGVLAHELAHVANRDILVASVAAGLATAVSHLANALAFTGMFGGGSQDEEGGSPAGGLALALLAPIGATLVQLGISRSREYLADETGARLAGDPLALAGALEKLHRAAEQLPSAATPATASLFIVNPFGALTGGLSRLFSTHPPAEERIRRLRALAQTVRGPAFEPAGAAPRSRLVR